MCSILARSSLPVVLTAVALLVAAPWASGASYWIWSSGIDCVSNQAVTVTPGETVTTISPSGNNVIFDPRIPTTAIVDSLMICFSTISGSISSTKLIETNAPNVSIIRLNDVTSRISNTADCYSIDVADFTPAGPLRLKLGVTSSTTFNIFMIGFKIAESVLAVVGDPVPTESLGLRNAPNPFERHTAIEFTLTRPGPATLHLYDAAGRRVRTLSAEGRSAGLQRILWDRKSDDGRTLEPGVYFYELLTSTVREARRAVVLR